ncbi:HTTM domain-containing protein [Flavivirga aquatica]|nr:HTTM domain-containing protein [Flavivirga aquatica]
MSTDLDLFFSENPKLFPQQLFYIQSPYFKYLQPIYNYLGEAGLTDFINPGILIMYGVTLLFVILGLFTRPMAILSLILQLFIYKSFAKLNYGFDNFMTMSLFYCVLFPIGKSYSLDTVLFKINEKIDFNYRRILQIHLMIAYFFSGIAKATDLGWWNGKSIWKAIASVDNEFYSTPSIILVLLGISTVLLEFLYPFLVWFKPTRKYTLFAIVSMHIGIAITMDLFAFSAIMIIWNLSAFGEINLNTKTKTKNEVAL